MSPGSSSLPTAEAHILRSACKQNRLAGARLQRFSLLKSHVKDRAGGASETPQPHRCHGKCTTVRPRPIFNSVKELLFFLACLVTSASGQGEMLPSAQIFRPKGEIVNSTHENDSETKRDPYGHLNEMPILVEFHFVHFMKFVIHPFLGDNRKPKQKSYNREQLLWCPVKRWAKFNTVQTRTNRTSYFNTEPPP